MIIPAIELRHISRRFGSVIALNDVSMAVNPRRGAFPVG